MCWFQESYWHNSEFLSIMQTHKTRRHSLMCWTVFRMLCIVLNEIKY
jgi:hypothetical protein